MIRSFFFWLMLCSVCPAAFAQVTVQEMPMHLALYAREVVTNQATIDASGVVDNAGVSYTEMRLKIYRNNLLQTTLTKSLTFSSGLANFSFSPSIPAEKAMYKFELYGFDGSSETLVQSADSVVAGDVYIISGQSNAEAPKFNTSTSASANESPYIRSFASGIDDGALLLSNLQWVLANGDSSGANIPTYGVGPGLGNTGQWGIRMARVLLDAYDIPVAIFNGAHGAQKIQFFFRNDASPEDLTTNYGRLLHRLNYNNLADKARAFFWFQGEADASAGKSINTYKAQFNALYSDWMVDYPNLEKFYLIQIRQGCYSTPKNNLNIQEAQRQLADADPLITLMSTKGISQRKDDCHYDYGDGYSLVGERMARVLRRDLFGEGLSDVEPPQIKGAELTGPNELTLTLLDPADTYLFEAGAEADFELTGTSATVTSGSISGNLVVLQLSGSALDITNVSYLGHEGAGTPFVKNINAIGMAGFDQYPVTIGTFPVEWAYFEAQAQPLGVALSWGTHQEVNNDRFEVERRTETSSWQPVASLSGAGTVSAPQAYQFLDRSAPAGRLYYRLRQVDLDGSFAYSEVRELTLDTPLHLSVYPNPIASQATVHLPAAWQGQMLQCALMDLTGRRLRQWTYGGQAPEMTLDLHDLKAGQYLLLIRSQNELLRHKLLKL